MATESKRIVYDENMLEHIERTVECEQTASIVIDDTFDDSKYISRTLRYGGRTWVLYDEFKAAVDRIIGEA